MLFTALMRLKNNLNILFQFFVLYRQRIKETDEERMRRQRWT